MFNVEVKLVAVNPATKVRFIKPEVWIIELWIIAFLLKIWKLMKSFK